MKSLLWSVAGLSLAAFGSADAGLYALPADGSAVIGKDSSVTTVYEDTLPDIAHRYSLGYYEIIRANPGVDVWLPGAGKQLTLPGRHITENRMRSAARPWCVGMTCRKPVSSWTAFFNR